MEYTIIINNYGPTMMNYGSNTPQKKKQGINSLEALGSHYLNFMKQLQQQYRQVTEQTNQNFSKKLFQPNYNTSSTVDQSYQGGSNPLMSILEEYDRKYRK